MLNGVSPLSGSGLIIYRPVRKDQLGEEKTFPFQRGEDSYESSGWQFVDQAREVARKLPGIAESEQEGGAFDSGPGAPGKGEKGQTESKADKPVKGETELSEDEKRVVRELKQTDSEVKAHERAHLAASAGISVSGASFEYETGPDGKRYAVGGEVKIDTSPGKTPEETIQKAQQIKKAALAPADPSSQDRAVARQAAAMESEARQDLNREKVEEQTQHDENEEIKSSQDFMQMLQFQKAFSAYSSAAGMLTTAETGSFFAVA